MLILVISVSQLSLSVISEVLVKLLQILGTKTLGSILKGFKCLDKVRKINNGCLCGSVPIDYKLQILKRAYNRKSE